LPTLALVRFAILTALSALAAGCSATAPHEPPAPTTTQKLVLGSNASGSFQPYADGDEVKLVEGAQGGFHVWLSYRASGVAAGEAELDRRAHRLSDGAVVLRYDTRTELAAPGADGFIDAMAPLPMFMCPTPIGISVLDTPIVFELSVAGARAAVTLTPHCPSNARDFCQRICTG
jgi:hypothetical protein